MFFVLMLGTLPSKSIQASLKQTSPQKPEKSFETALQGSFFKNETFNLLYLNLQHLHLLQSDISVGFSPTPKSLWRCPLILSYNTTDQSGIGTVIYIIHLSSAFPASNRKLGKQANDGKQVRIYSIVGFLKAGQGCGGGRSIRVYAEGFSRLQIVLCTRAVSAMFCSFTFLRFLCGSHDCTAASSWSR